MTQVTIYNVTVGMNLAKDIKDPDTNKLLLKKGNVITAHYLNLFKTHGIHQIWVNDPYTIDVDPKMITANELKNLLIEQITKFAPNHREANTSDEMVNVSQQAKEIATTIVSDPEVIRICTEMKLMNRKLLYEHCINACALSLLVAGAMNLGDKSMEAIGTGALLHDLGLCEMPQLLEISQKSKQEDNLWREHPQYGYYLAKEAGFRKETCEFILNHHEYCNGTGYPNGLKGEKIPLGARIIAVCEMYDSLVRLQHYPRYQAIESLYGGGGILFDGNVVKTMCNHLAVYPLGSMVRLSSNEVGVVVNVRKNLGPRPIVYVYYNRLNKPYENPKQIDLGKELTLFIKEVL